MTRIVRSSYRYKRPPGKRKPVVIEGPAVITAASKRRRASDEAKAALAASLKLAPGEPEPKPAIATSRAGTAAKPAIVTIRRKSAKPLLTGLLPETQEEHQRRGDAADAVWRELVRRVRNHDQIGSHR